MLNLTKSYRRLQRRRETLASLHQTVREEAAQLSEKLNLYVALRFRGQFPERAVIVKNGVPHQLLSANTYDPTISIMAVDGHEYCGEGQWTGNAIPEGMEVAIATFCKNVTAELGIKIELFVWDIG